MFHTLSGMIMFLSSVLSLALAVLLNAGGARPYDAATHLRTTGARTTPADAHRFGILAGRITGYENGPINGAVIELAGTSPALGSYARPDGSYRIGRLKPGRYTVVARAESGFKERTLTVEITAGATTTLDISLKPAPVRLSKKEDKVMGKGSVLSYRSTLSGKGAPSMDMDAAPASGAERATAAPEASEATRRARVDEGESIRETGDTVTTQRPVQKSGQLTAAEWSDLANWSYWSDVAATEEWKGKIAAWGFDPSSRVIVRVFDRTTPVIDAQIRLVDAGGTTLWTARTDNRGNAELFAGVAGKAEGARVQVRRGSEFVDAGMATPGLNTPVMVSMPGGAQRRDEFDMAFMIDATGSMGDEMEYLKAELENVVDRIRETSTDELSIRLSCNVYRDQGDDYVVRTFPFDESTFKMIGHLRKQFAGGGGDFPEAVEEGLEAAIEKLEWRSSARARLLFLVLDAPPHHTPDRVAKLQSLAARAAAKGIRIIPLAASGVNKETEFLLRPLAIYTGGTYLFLTDDSGIGNSHMKPTIGEHKVEYLNDLMVKVITRYLAADVLNAENGNGLDLR